MKLRNSKSSSELRYLRAILPLSDEAGTYGCKKCGFETNSEEIFEQHKKNCPRI